MFFKNRAQKAGKPTAVKPRKATNLIWKLFQKRKPAASCMWGSANLDLVVAKAGSNDVGLRSWASGELFKNLDKDEQQVWNKKADDAAKNKQTDWAT